MTFDIIWLIMPWCAFLYFIFGKFPFLPKIHNMRWKTVLSFITCHLSLQCIWGTEVIVHERIVRWRTGHIIASGLTWHYCGDWTSNPRVPTQQHTQHTIKYTIKYLITRDITTFIFNTLDSFSVVYHTSYSYVQHTLTFNRFIRPNTTRTLRKLIHAEDYQPSR